MSKKLTVEQINDLVDVVTSEHPEFADPLAVRAAIEHAAKENPHLAGVAIANAAVASLKEMDVPAEDTQELAGMPQETLDAMKAETIEEAQEVAVEPAGEPVVTMPALQPGETVTVTNKGVEGAVCMDFAQTADAAVLSHIRNLTAENHILLRENRELRMQVEHMRVALHIPPTAGAEGVIAPAKAPAPFYAYTVTVNNASLVPEKYKGVDGRPDLAMLHADVNAAGGPKVVPGCLIGRKQ